MGKRRKGGHDRTKADGSAPPSQPPRSAGKDVAGRLVVLALCLGLAYALGSMGRHILKTGEYDYVLETSDGTGGLSRRDADVKREEVHATGAWAREQGIGFVATAVTLAFWSVIILWGMAGPFALRAQWSPVHTVLTALSLACCLTAVVAFFPPWRIGWSMACNAFYIVMGAIVYIAALRDREKIQARSRKIFPGLICSAVVLGTFFSGYLIGIIAGILIGILLATHVLLLVPKLRAEFWNP